MQMRYILVVTRYPLAGLTPPPPLRNPVSTNDGGNCMINIQFQTILSRL